MTRRFSTRTVLSGERKSPIAAHPTVTPIYQSSSFYYDTPEALDQAFDDPEAGYSYARYGNPTVSAFEEAVADLEDTEGAFATSSGMAAVHLALLATGLSSGDTVLASQDVYGATISLLSGLMPRFGIHTVFADFQNAEGVSSLIERHQPKVVLFEVLTNPLMRVINGPAITRLAHDAGAAVIVDNTFTTPYLHRPASHGADLVIHSTTKYLSGHGDMLGGIIATSRDYRGRLFELNKMVGSVAGPLDTYLALRGLKTLPLRVARQNETAATLAEELARHPQVRKVHFPGLPDSPAHALAARLFRSGCFGAMIGFELDGGRPAVFRFMKALELVLPATTLGDVYSLMLYPAMSSHRALSPEQREAIGISDGLIRLSVGVEAPADILADLEQALELAHP